MIAGASFSGTEDGLLIINASDPEESLLQLCDRLGIVVECRAVGTLTWDGTSLRWPLDNDRTHPAWLAHEIGHWLVASPEHRTKPNYEFWRDPHSGWRNANGRGRHKFDPEEQEALWLGMLLGTYMGLDPFDMEDVLDVTRGEKLRTRLELTIGALTKKKLVAKILSGGPIGPREWRLSNYVPTIKALGLCSDLEERVHPAVRQAA